MASSASAAPSINDRKDRSIRLWGERGQKALEQGHVVCLNATVVATEVLKNLVLPGVGKFTIVDNKRVSEKDLGNNFFLDMDCLGKLRAEHVTRLLVEMNSEVVGDFVDEDPVSMIQDNSSYLLNASVVIATDLPETSLMTLASLLWAKSIPLFIGRAYGMVGYWRNVLPEVSIIESRPDFGKENFRLSDPFPEMSAFAAQFDLDRVTHPHIVNLEKQEAPRRWVDGAGVECVPKAHSHVPCFVILIKAMEAWKSTHGGLPPKTSAEKDAFKRTLDEMQLSPALDEENFCEAKSQARHVLAPFEVPSEVSCLFRDDKASHDSSCDEAFWVLVRGLKMFVEAEGAGRLPLSGSLPDMHSDTKSYVELQTLYKNKAAAECAMVLAHVRMVLQQLGKPTDHVTAEDVALVCKNATNLRLVRTRSIEEEYTKPKAEEWSWMLDNREENPHHLYVLLRAADRFRTHFGAFPGASEASVAELAKFKEVVGTVCSEMGISVSSLGDEMMQEMVRYGGAELHTIAAVIGGVGAQEVTKVLMQQFVPMNGTFLWNGVTSKNGLCIF
mmetsp:Transcript_769/g.2042  ORF Transcript_769/g.2042 Transcript_769/m.2042 type:complete len:557 (+) Transcript_769:145-1815(+)|eukprot:CAMPEP_0173421958 /NCGR_PEP_ID=MMETSP1357-20121228/2853_1 /TAXON_ID=77926 /ORGANISM="Hemiselmis rufescens, Strain PCC563" /LENGTH=556 /DNA_ID=CAMNT_0014384925 /DNA_START=142 /DNA_END=1812 /DNA_ORIENTATION=+